MIKMDRPDLGAHEVFRTCIERIRSEDLKARMISVVDDVVEASINFEELAAATRLHLFPREGVVGGIINTAEMEAVYTQRMAKKGAPGREVYDIIIGSAPNGKCPLCGHRTVSTLDHHLPKSHYPVLSVVPLNLVPACSDCNKAKLAGTPSRPNDEALHPYFDNIDDDRWLYAEVLEGSPAALRFRVQAPAHWDEILADRVKLHFKTLNIGVLYAAESADELLNIRHQLRLIFANGGALSVRNELQHRAESCRSVRRNSWRAVAYEAFSECEWFCNGGFDQA